MTRRSSRRGMALVMVALSSIVLVPVIGLAIDGATLYVLRTRLSQAADAAALAAARNLGSSDLAVETPLAQATAARYFHANFPAGYWATSNAAVAAVVNEDPLTHQRSVSVTAGVDAPLIFMKILNRSTAHVFSAPTAWRPPAGCIYVLDPKSPDAMRVAGNPQITAKCPVIVDSASDHGLRIMGNAELDATEIRVVGDYKLDGGGIANPLPIPHSAPQPDPLAYVPAPAVGPCDVDHFQSHKDDVETLSPGVYCNGIEAHGGMLTLNPGTYVLLGGGLKVDAQTTIIGNGVTLYLAQDATYNYEGVEIAGGAVVQLSAPTTGPLAGIVIFQDRSVHEKKASRIDGGADTIFNGAVYFPTTELSYRGGATLGYTIIVAWQLQLNGGANLYSDYSSLPGGSPVRASAALSK